MKKLFIIFFILSIGFGGCGPIIPKNSTFGIVLQIMDLVENPPSKGGYTYNDKEEEEDLR